MKIICQKCSAVNPSGARKCHNCGKNLHTMKTPLTSAKWLLLGVVVIAASMLVSCGGTFSLRPDGTFAYTTPELIRPDTRSAK